MRMAMAASLVATPMTPSASVPTAAAFSVIEQHHGIGAISVRRIAAVWDSSSFSSCCCRNLSPDSASAGLSTSSGGRDGGACCVAAAATACSVTASRWSGRSRRNAADRLGWRTCMGGMVMLNGLEATARRKNSAAAPALAPAPRWLPLRIAAEKPDLTNVAGTLLRLGKQGLEAGTKLVPESVPRPVAQAGVGLAGVLLASFLLKSLFSTVTFILAIGALSYAGYFFLTKGDSSSSSDKGGDGSSDKPKSTDEALEEARRIMEKYK